MHSAALGYRPSSPLSLRIWVCIGWYGALVSISLTTREKKKKNSRSKSPGVLKRDGCLTESSYKRCGSWWQLRGEGLLA